MLDRLRPFIMHKQEWLQVSLVADGEMAEAISEVLSRFVSGGVVIESTRIADEPDGEGHPTGPLRVSGYLQIDDQLEDTKQKLLEALWYLGRIRPVSEAEFSPVADLNWSEIWKEHFQPVQVGEELDIIPAWMDAENSQRLAIKIDPGMAFGTGTHPTTQLCLEIIADLIEAVEVENRRSIGMIDIGCGSGILGIAALKLGAGMALGVDQDRDAVEAALQNARLNGVMDGLELGVGSLAEISAGSFSISKAKIVVANILAPVITQLLRDGLGGIVSPGGRLVLSGILVDQVPEVEAALTAANFSLVKQIQMGDWVALVAGEPSSI